MIHQLGFCWCGCAHPTMKDIAQKRALETISEALGGSYTARGDATTVMAALRSAGLEVVAL